MRCLDADQPEQELQVAVSLPAALAVDETTRCNPLLISFAEHGALFPFGRFHDSLWDGQVERVRNGYSSPSDDAMKRSDLDGPSAVITTKIPSPAGFRALAAAARVVCRPR
jgi:hypothetical protein